MFLPAIGLLLGIALGLCVDFYVPPAYTIYMAMAILASLDSVLGAVIANFDGKFNFGIFMTGFFGNAIIAVALTFTGNLLGVDFSLATIVVFGVRLFNNFASLRRIIIAKYDAKKEAN